MAKSIDRQRYASTEPYQKHYVARMRIGPQPALQSALLGLASTFLLLSPGAWAGDASANYLKGNQAVGDRVNAAFRSMAPLPRDLLADTVEVTHVPHIANDPERVGKEQLGTSDLAALKNALTDLDFRVLWTKTTATGFITALQIHGTQRNGRPFSTKIVMDFAVTQGLITAFKAKQDPAERAALEQIEKDGGFQAKQ
jgi:hypothetical protein